MLEQPSPDEAESDLGLAHKTALVTGASRGIGKAVSAALSRRGVNVMLVSRKPEALEAAIADIRSNGARSDLDACVANAGEPEDAYDCVQATLARFGSVDILVNNAATNPYIGPLVGIDRSQALKSFAVNQFGPVAWTRAAWEGWLSEHGGAIVNIASIGGFRTKDGIGFYNATKAALIHLTRQLAYELAPHTRVNAVAPGLVKTDIARALWESQAEDAAARLPLRRLGRPEDIASAVIFLASDQAAWITGQTLVADGGATVMPVMETQGLLQ